MNDEREDEGVTNSSLQQPDEAEPDLVFLPPEAFEDLYELSTECDRRARHLADQSDKLKGRRV